MQIKLEFIMNSQRVPKTTENSKIQYANTMAKEFNFSVCHQSQTHTEIQHHQNPIIRIQRSTNFVPRVDLVFRIQFITKHCQSSESSTEIAENAQIADNQKIIGLEQNYPSNRSHHELPSTVARGITSLGWNPSSAATVASNRGAKSV